MVDDPEGEARGKDEIRDGQVKDENVGERLEVFVQTQDDEDKNISCEAQCDHHREEHRNDNRSKFDQFAFVTDFIIIITSVIIHAVI